MCCCIKLQLMIYDVFDVEKNMIKNMCTRCLMYCLNENEHANMCYKVFEELPM